MFVRLRYWLVKLLGGESKVYLNVPVYRPVRKMDAGDYRAIINMFNAYPQYHDYLTYLVDHCERQLSQTPYTSEYDRARIAWQSKLHMAKDLIDLPTRAVDLINELERERDINYEVLNNFGEEQKEKV